MRTQRMVNRCLLGLVAVLFGSVYWSYGQAEQEVDKGDEMAFAETRVTGEAGGNVLEAEEKDAFLKAHNDARKEVGLEALVWSNDIGRYSLQWIKINHNNYFDAAVAGKSPPTEHRPYEGEFKQKYGENLAWWSGPSSTETSARKAVSQWLLKKTAFDKLNQQKPYAVGEERGKTDANGKPIVVSHYTQIVWKDTKKIGAARWTFKSKDRTVVVIVCNYDPTGNYTGQKPY